VSDYLTPAERRAVEQAQLKERNQRKRSLIRKRAAREAQRARRLREALEVKTPPVPLLEMYGPEQTTLPATIRQDTVPYDKTVPLDIPPDPFIEEIVTQEGFRQIMGDDIKDERVARFLKLIYQAENRSMTWCAKTVGLTNSDLAKIWCDSTLRSAYFRIVKRMPQVVDKVVNDALGSQKSCPRCDGLGRIDVPEHMREFFDEQVTTICPNCEGRKTVAAPGLPQATERIWERVGWSKKGAGVTVSVNMSDHSVDATIGEMDDLEVLEHRP
jgi:hypothetical protein